MVRRVAELFIACRAEHRIIEAGKSTRRIMAGTRCSALMATKRACIIGRHGRYGCARVIELCKQRNDNN